MTTSTKRQPWHGQDADGTPVTFVPLANHPEPAVLLTEDFERLVHLGVTTSWCFNWGRPGKHYLIAQLTHPQ